MWRSIHDRQLPRQQRESLMSRPAKFLAGENCLVTETLEVLQSKTLTKGGPAHGITLWPAGPDVRHIFVRCAARPIAIAPQYVSEARRQRSQMFVTATRARSTAAGGAPASRPIAPQSCSSPNQYTYPMHTAGARPSPAVQCTYTLHGAELKSSSCPPQNSVSDLIARGASQGGAPLAVLQRLPHHLHCGGHDLAKRIRVKIHRLRRCSRAL